MLHGSFDQDDARSNHSVKRDQPSREVSGAGKRDAAKVTKKAGKCCACFCVNLFYYLDSLFA